VALLCSGGGDIAGGTTETGNSKLASIDGWVTDSAGISQAGVSITALPASYNPATASSTVGAGTALSDTDGSFAIDSLEAGTYTISARLTEMARGGLVFGVTAEPEIPAQVMIELRRPARLDLRVTERAYRESAVFYVPGTSHYAEVGADRTASIDSLFARVVNLVYYDPASGDAVARLTNIPVCFGTCVVDCTAYAVSSGGETVSGHRISVRCTR
jgi:hypothetical protein